VEVFHNGTWGTICEQGFGFHEANTVCKQLNYGAAIKVDTSVLPGDGPVWLSHVRCSGWETAIDFCTDVNFGPHSCYQNREQVGVKCYTRPEGVYDTLQLVRKGFIVHYKVWLSIVSIKW